MSDLPRLLDMWNAGARVADIAMAFGVSSSQVYRWRTVYRLPNRAPTPNRPTPDPTPSEIERLKAEIRERNRIAMLTETDSETRARVWREREGAA